MVLPLLPVIAHLNDLDSQSRPLTKNGFTAIGQVMLSAHVNELPAVLDKVRTLSSWLNIIVDIEFLSVDQSIQLLDAGAAKIVVPKSQLADLTDIPAERLIVRMTEDQVTNSTEIEDVANSVAGMILQSSFSLCDDPEALKSIVKSLRTSYLPSGGERIVHIEYSATAPPPIIAELKSLALLSIEPIITASYLTCSPRQHPNLLSVAQIALLGAKTDRRDGLYSTVVVDERGHALGLVYSSAESIAETIRTGTGVYQSRRRGLWHKGATSGATQEIISMSWDCDADCLCYTVKQAGKGDLSSYQTNSGFCHTERMSCFGPTTGLSLLEQTLKSRKESAPEGSYVGRLFSDPSLLRSKIMEEAEEVCDAAEPTDIAWEVADLIFFAMTKCVANGVSLADVEAQLDKRAKKISRRKGDAKPKWTNSDRPVTDGTPSEVKAVEKADPAQVGETLPPADQDTRIKMRVYQAKSLSPSKRTALLSRPIQKTAQIMPIVQTIIDAVKSRGDSALLEYTAKFEKANLSSPVLKAPFPPKLMALPDSTKHAIDIAFENIKTFHSAQLESPKHVQTMPGITCSRFARPIDRVGLYVPGGTAVLPSTAMMLGIPALVAGCNNIQFATPPRPDGSVVPEIVYIASKVGATRIVLAGGAQAVAALAYGTESIEKCDKIFGPGNQFVTAAKMCVQSDAAALVGVDLPAGPSEVLVFSSRVYKLIGRLSRTRPQIRSLWHRICCLRLSMVLIRWLFLSLLDCRKRN